MICAFGKQGTLSACGRHQGARVAAKQTCLQGRYHFSHSSIPHCSLPTCPEAPQGVLLARRPRGGVGEGKYGDEIKSTFLPGLQPAGRCQFTGWLCQLAGNGSCPALLRGCQEGAGSSPEPPEPLGTSLQGPGEQILQLPQQHPPSSHPFLGAALLPWFYGLDLLHSSSSSQVRLQTGAIL